MGVKCAIKGCRSVYSHNNHSRPIRFFRFPHPIHEVQLNQWKLACNDDDIMVTDNERLYHMRICSLHFEDNMMRKYRLKEDAVPTLNLEAPSATSIYEEHSYFRDGNLEVGHYVDIDESVPDYGMDVISRSIGTQTDLSTMNMGTQTCCVYTSDCQIQTEKELSARTPRKLKLLKEIKDQKANMKLKEKEKARLQLSFDKQVNQEEEIFVIYV